MKRDALQRRLQQAESLAQGLAENVAFRRQMIATLDQKANANRVIAASARSWSNALDFLRSRRLVQNGDALACERFLP